MRTQPTHPQLLESKSAGWQSPDPLLGVPLKETTFVGKDVLLRMLAAAKLMERFTAIPIQTPVGAKVGGGGGAVKIDKLSLKVT